MDSLLLPIFFLTLTCAHATMPAQTYWRTVLPQTPIPASIQELLRPEKTNEASFELKKPPTVFISYKCATTEDQIHNDPYTPFFFIKDNLNPGLRMTLDLTWFDLTPPFLSVEKAKITPFSSAKLSEILKYFLIKHSSPEAHAMMQTLMECEELPLNNDKKRCVTSLEAMVDFVREELGERNVRVVETSTVGGSIIAQRQEYVVGPKGVRLLIAEGMVSCHPEQYPRAVYYCHRTNIEVYKVQLLGLNGVEVDAVATCHKDTAAWNPEYIGFKMLNVKPGTDPICHFLPQGHLIFSRFPKKATNSI